MPAIPVPHFDTFYRHPELTRLLQDYAAARPALIELRSIGQSHEGRDIWVATVTSTKTGPAADKPAFWVDGNIHATEVAASAAAVSSQTMPGRPSPERPSSSPARRPPPTLPAERSSSLVPTDRRAR